MSVLAWIASVLGGFVVLTVAVVALALVSLIRVEGRIAPEGASARGRWGAFGFEVDAVADRFELRVLGLRVVRTSLRRDAAQAHDAEAKARKTEEREEPRRGRRRLTIGAYRRLARQGWRELRRVRRIVHVDRLRLEAVLASDDPAWTGEAYGIGCAVLGVVRGWWPHADVHVAADFVGTEPRGAGELALRVRPVRLVPGAARVGWAYWRERRLTRRRA